MKPMKTLLIAFALAGACASVSGAEQNTADKPPAGDRARAGFFFVPTRPLAYSFADICNLSIDLRPVPVQIAANAPPLAPGLASIWTQADKTKPADPDKDNEAAAPVAATRQPDADPSPLPALMPEPADWMRLCGFAIIVLIAKRRRDWSVRRGLVLGDTMPLRPRAADRELPNQPVVRLD